MIRKVTITLVAALLMFQYSVYAAIAPAGTSTLRATKISDIPGFAESEYGSLGDLTIDEFLELKPREVAEKTGQRMKFKDRIVFKMVKKNMRKQLKKAEKNEKTEFTPPQEVRKSFNWGAFFLGLLLGLIGFIISFFFKDKNAWKSALIGLAVAVVAYVLIFAL